MFTSASFHAPTPTILFNPFSQSLPSSASPLSNLNRSIRLPMAASIRIVLVGDIHDDWNLLEDSKALEFLKPDLVLFTGDFGNENVKLVTSIAALKMTKAAILGNMMLGILKSSLISQKIKMVSNSSWKDPLFLPVTRLDQNEYFGKEHVGYKRLDFHSLKLRVIGGRPFSCGGEKLFRKNLLAKGYGVHNMNQSAKRISDAATGTPRNHSIILLAHNGPTGLGSNLNDICGKDWVREGGDHGDPDLELAISQLKGNPEYSVPLVVFGYMHKELTYGNGPRKMIVLGDDNTTYLNGAIVPWVKRFCDKQQTHTSSSSTTDTLTSTPHSEGTLRAFTLIESKDGKLQKITETWVSVIGDNTALVEENILFSNNVCNISNL